MLLVLVTVSACDAASGSTTSAISNLGGDGLPVQVPGESYGHESTQLTGVLILEGNGCWEIDKGDGPRVVIFPQGYTKPPSDGAMMLSPDGLEIRDGLEVTALGGSIEASTLPGGSDGFWGGYMTFCQPELGEVVVIDSLQPAITPGG